jgi:hypothetical protein
MGIGASHLDPHTASIADCVSMINAQAISITALQNAILTLTNALADKANVAGQVFTGAISSPTLSGDNSGDQQAAALAAPTSSDVTTGDATGTGLGLGIYPSLAEFNARWNEIKSKFNALRVDIEALKTTMKAGPHPILAT